MDKQQGDINNSLQAHPQRVIQDVPKKFTPKSRRSFTTAREYKKLFSRRVKQVPKTQSIQEFQKVVDQNFWFCFFWLCSSVHYVTLWLVGNKILKFGLVETIMLLAVFVLNDKVK